MYIAGIIVKRCARHNVHGFIEHILHPIPAGHHFVKIPFQARRHGQQMHQYDGLFEIVFVFEGSFREKIQNQIIDTVNLAFLDSYSNQG